MADLPKRRNDVHSTELEGEGVIYDPIADKGFYLNETSLFIWKQCDGTRTLDQIERELAEAYDVSPNARSDLETIISNFDVQGLLESKHQC